MFLCSSSSFSFFFCSSNDPCEKLSSPSLFSSRHSEAWKLMQKKRKFNLVFFPLFIYPVFCGSDLMMSSFFSGSKIFYYNCFFSKASSVWLQRLKENVFGRWPTQVYMALITEIEYGTGKGKMGIRRAAKTNQFSGKKGKRILFGK